MMKKLLTIFILLIPSMLYAASAWDSGDIKKNSNCNQSLYYSIGKLCVDTDDAKLYKGTGSAVVEISNIVTGLTSASSVAITGGTINGTAIGATTPAAGTFTTVTGTASINIGTSNAIESNALRGQTVSGFSGMLGTGTAVNDWYGIAMGVHCINDAKNAFVDGNVSFAGGNDSHAEGNRTVTGRRRYVVNSQGVDTDVDVGEKAFVILTVDGVNVSYGDVTSFFPNAYTTDITTRYGAGAQADVKGNIYPSGMTPATWSGDTITAANDLKWAMHPYMVLKGSSEPEISIVKILKSSYNAGTGTKIYYDSATSAYTTISSVYSSYAPTVNPDSTGLMGNGQHSEGFKTSASGYGAHSEGYKTHSWNAGAHSEGFASIATGHAAHAQGRYTRASGYASFSAGETTTASGSGSVVIGYNSTASGVRSIAIGKSMTVSGEDSVGISLSSGGTLAQNNTLAIMGGKVGIGYVAPYGTGSSLSVYGDIHQRNGYKIGYLGSSDADTTHNGYMLPYDVNGNLQIVTTYSGSSINLLPHKGVAIGIATAESGSGITEKLEVGGNITFKGTTGGFVHKRSEAVSAALSGASGSIAVNVPSGSRILGVQLRVDTAITSGDGGTTWTAAYVNTPTTAITSGQAFTKNTKFNAIHPAYEITTDTVTITITPNSGTFSGGVVRAIVYYEVIAAMGDAS
jgi:hypothetical protein